MAEFTNPQRKALAAKGEAMPDGGFPIRNRADLLNAIQSVGRAGGPEEQKKVRKFIIKRANALGLSGLLPATWASDGTTKAAG